MHSAEPNKPGRSEDRAEAELGGADAVEKTTYVVGQGTDPDARTVAPYAARGAGGAGGAVIWIVGALAALIALFYIAGIFR